jgi:hypothetical protein
LDSSDCGKPTQIPLNGALGLNITRADRLSSQLTIRTWPDGLSSVD